jgi:branched-chain amino acid transport system ATP-binding protein/urea transport system ATP-binding protein
MSLEERRVTGKLLSPIKQQCAILIVEHDLDFIRDVSDVLTVLDQGSVLDWGTIDEIRRSRKVQEVYLSRA